MRNNKLHTPAGVRDLLPQECKAKKEIIKRIDKVFSEFGYNEVENPSFEYIEVFSNENMGATSYNNMFKFFDKDGEILVLRSDITPQIARMLATAYPESSLPLRFSYFGNVYKSSETYRGKLNELSQAGIELLGVDNLYADGEVIAVAVKSLLNVGITDFRINVGQVKFFKGILSESGLSQEDCNLVQELTAKKDYVALENFIKASSIKESTGKLFLELPKLVGKEEVIKYALKLTDNDDAKAALYEMEKLYEVLKLYGVENYINFDLGMVNHLNYYTGIIFRGYTYGSSYAIAAGGRYDNLVEQFGMKCPAVGFSIKVNELYEAVKYQKINLIKPKTSALIAYKEEGILSAYNIAKKYREANICVEISLLGDDFEKNKKYAEERDFSHMFYFTDNENLSLVSFKDEFGGFTIDITVDELVMPEVETI